jgi:hypothetical protein
MMCIPMPDTVNDHDAVGFIVNPLTAAATVALTDVMDTLADVLQDPRGKVFIKP